MKIFKNFFIQVNKLDGKWGKVMKNYLIVSLVLIPLIVIFFIIKLFFENYPVNIYAIPIEDEVLIKRIITRINDEDVSVKVSPNGIIKVKNVDTARRMRAILIEENLDPHSWKIIDKERWTLTDFEKKILRQREQHIKIEDNLKAIKGIKKVILNIKWPEERSFNKDEEPVFVTVILTLKTFNNITEKTILLNEIRKILLNSIPDLIDENILILDNRGNVFDNSN